MKKMNGVLAAAAIAAVVSITSVARAQYVALGDDGIAASPKLRAQLNDRKAITPVAARAGESVVAKEKTAGPAAPVVIVASPRVAQMDAERAAREKAPVE